MDRPVKGGKTEREWNDIVHSLLALSQTIEARSSRFHPDTVQSLDLLGTLATTARQSLPVMASPAAAPTSSPTSETPPAPKTLEVRYGSEKPEYQAALQDKSLIDALLDFHHKSRENQNLLRPFAEFAPQELEKIEAKPKQRPIPRKSHGIGYPILRSPRP